MGGLGGGVEQGILTVTVFTTDTLIVLVSVLVAVLTSVLVTTSVIVLTSVMVLYTGVGTVMVLMMVVGGGHLTDLGGGGGTFDGAPRPSMTAAETATMERSIKKRRVRSIMKVICSSGNWRIGRGNEPILYSTFGN